MQDLIFNTNYSPNPGDYFMKDQIKSAKIYKAKNPALSFFTPNSMPNSRNGRAFRDGEYDLYEIGRIIDTESLVARAFNKKNTLIFRDGFTIKSNNEKNLAYIKQRIEEIQYVSENKFEDLLMEYSYNLVAYHNPYIVKVRKDEASSGKRRRLKGKKEIKPVAAYYCLAPETMQKRLSDAGDAERFRQYLSGGRYREFAVHNILYTPYNKRTGFTMGTPPLEAVKEDILALRRIEESVETLIYKSLFPIIHVKVGTEKSPAKTLPSGITEVDASTRLLENIDDNGGIVTSERIDISSIGAESLALRVESYLDHFKKRVFAGLGMSAIDFGDGDATGRATGEVLSSSLRDSVVTYQKILAEVVTTDIFTELLLESGQYDHPFQISEDDRVYLEFNTVDTDEKIKKESHTLNKMSHGILKINEARSELGLPPLAPADLKDLHTVVMEDISIQQQITLAAAQAKLAPKPAVAGKPSSGAKTKGGNGKSKTDKKAGAKKATESVTKPKNQYSAKIDDLSLYVHSIQDIELVGMKMHRELSDIAMLEVSSGLIDGKGFVPNDVLKLVDKALSEFIEETSKDCMGFTDVRSKIKKTIDKLCIYVNNIDLG